MACLDTIWPADTFEFCPHQEHSDIAVCGTYYLDQAQSVVSVNAGEHADDLQHQKRDGKILLLEVTEDDKDVKLRNLQEVALPAVLDLKWCHRQPTASPILASADSEGGLNIFEYQEAQLVLTESIACAKSHILCLSIDWSNRRIPSTGLGSLAVSLSDGNISIYQPSDSKLVHARTWFAHDYEPWVAAWDYWNTSVVYSGGDDLRMKAWDVREDCTKPIFTNQRQVVFEAGVTSIQSHPYVEHILAVGSYDDTVRLFDVRKPLVPLIRTDVGGGAWRVKWHPSSKRKTDLLVACMHDGAKIVHFSHDVFGSSESKSWEVARSFDKHESMAYGVDWSFKSPNDDDTLIASCSFYDHVLYTWKG